MNDITRRTTLGGLATLTLANGAQARAIGEIRIAANDGEVLAQQYAAARDGKRAIVLALPGTGGFELNPRGYARYPEALAAPGIDAWLVDYATAADARARSIRRRARGTAAAPTTRDGSRAGRGGYHPW